MTSNEYTPTDADVREAYAKRRALYLSANGMGVLASGPHYSREDYAEFDRWLAVRDAAVRAVDTETKP